MSEKILVPVLGESINEATVSKWLKKEGDSVNADEPIVELETDKVNLEVPSPVSGVLTKINSKNGATVEVGAILGSVSENKSISKKSEGVKKIEPLIEEDKPVKEENNVIKLEPQKEIEEPKIFDENNHDEAEPLILTKEVYEEKEQLKTDKNQTLSPSVRKIVLKIILILNQ